MSMISITDAIKRLRSSRLGLGCERCRSNPLQVGDVCRALPPDAPAYLYEKTDLLDYIPNSLGHIRRGDLASSSTTPVIDKPSFAYYPILYRSPDAAVQREWCKVAQDGSVVSPRYGVTAALVGEGDPDQVIIAPGLSGTLMKLPDDDTPLPQLNVTYEDRDVLGCLGFGGTHIVSYKYFDIWGMDYDDSVMSRHCPIALGKYYTVARKQQPVAPVTTATAKQLLCEVLALVPDPSPPGTPKRRIWLSWNTVQSRRKNVQARANSILRSTLVFVNLGVNYAEDTQTSQTSRYHPVLCLAVSDDALHDITDEYDTQRLIVLRSIPYDSDHDNFRTVEPVPAELTDILFARVGAPRFSIDLTLLRGIRATSVTIPTSKKHPRILLSNSPYDSAGKFWNAVSKKLEDLYVTPV